jgi:uncharacterized lipoprotein YajG
MKQQARNLLWIVFGLTGVLFLAACSRAERPASATPAAGVASSVSIE